MQFGTNWTCYQNAISPVGQLTIPNNCALQLYDIRRSLFTWELAENIVGRRLDGMSSNLSRRTKLYFIQLSQRQEDMQDKLRWGKGRLRNRKNDCFNRMDLSSDEGKHFVMYLFIHFVTAVQISSCYATLRHQL